jgi:hypothetical protein
MRSVTEFANFTLNQALKAKTALTAEGKTPEEVQTALAETFKLEGDKLKYFIHALDIAGANPDGLKRIRVVALAEGEAAPAKSTQIEEMTYLPEFHVTARPPEAAEEGGQGRRGRGRGGRDRGRGGPRRDQREAGGASLGDAPKPEPKRPPVTKITRRA